MILIGDCRETLKQLPDGSVDCCTTSPPYWGLRDYGADGQIGLEQTPQEYIAQMLVVFGEVWRVLADHGTCFVNLGDSYAAGTTAARQDSTCKAVGGWSREGIVGRSGRIHDPELKAKDLIGIPWRVAFALQDAGWYLRQDIVWHKPAPMPSSVKDRCTTSHEYIFLLTKKPRYFWDWYAISEETNPESAARYRQPFNSFNGGLETGQISRNTADSEIAFPNRRNKRSVWTINTVSYTGAHFAVFPPELARTCILAGCPELVCLECGTPQERIIETSREATRPGNDTKVGLASAFEDSPYHDHTIAGNRDPQRHCTTYVDKGFAPACDCNAEFRRGSVLDPFLGSGTTGQVAQELGRDWIGCELNPEYEPLIKRRTEQPFLF